MVVPNINPANQDPEAETGYVQGVISSHRLIMEKS